MSSLLFAELTATCNALGYYDGIKYHKDVHCLETIKDLIRYLRRDDDSHEIRRFLGEANIMKNDLIPIFKDYSDDKDLFETILRLLVNLTNPVLILFREELPEDKTNRNHYLKMVGHLQSYKEAFVDEKIWTILGEKLGDVLKIEWQERDDDMNMSIMRILTLARNILQVPADPTTEKRPDNDASLHDQILWSFHVSGLVDIFLYVACSENEDQYYMHILEIVSQMLREQNSAQLAVAAAQRSVTEQTRDESELLAIRERESQARREKRQKFASARHSRFLGTYCVKNVQSISDRELIYHRPLNTLESLDLDRDKKKIKTPKNRMPLKEDNQERRSAFSIRLFLKEFCIEFLNGAYNNLMYRVKSMITGGETQANDESYYLWALKFFMEFNRCYKFRVELVSETISLQTFHFVQSQIENYFEMMKIDKKKIPIWSKRLHIAVKAYQELLHTLGAMGSSPDSKIRDSAQVLKSNIFYVVEYRELSLTLLVSYAPEKMSMACLQDLICTVHIFMKLLEAHCHSNRKILVQKKGIQRKKGKKKKSAAGNKESAEEKEKNLESQWEEIGPELSAVLQSELEISNDIVPFDATSDVSIDDQRAGAMRRIHNLLREHKIEEAVGLLRASREVWPENDYFGNSSMAPEDEFMAMREIYFADIKLPDTTSSAGDQNEGALEPVEQEVNEENPSEDEDEEDEEGGAHHASVAEQDFQFPEFLKRFAKPKVIQPCARILRDFKTNNPKVNHCVLRLMHRIAVECHLPALFFQASLFRTFQKILEEYRYSLSRRSSSNPGEREKDLKELAKFAVFIIRKFKEVAQSNPKAFMELLFWKNARDAYDIESGYGSYKEKTASAKAVWSEEQEDEIRRLCEEFTSKGVPESSLVDEVHNNIIDRERSKRAIKKKMKELGLITTEGSRKLSRPSKQWAEEEVEQLTLLYQELKETFDPVGMIMDRLSVKRPKHRVIEKLLELGLANTRSELYKKRKSGTGKSNGDKSGPHRNVTDQSSDSSSDRSSSSSEEEDHPSIKVKRTKKNASSRRSQPIKSNFSTTEVTQSVKKAIDLGFSSALEWLVESLEEAAEEEGKESVPLLPITEDAIEAMDNPDFIKIVKIMGFMEPNKEQEIYWRIPADCTPCDLRTRAQVIDFILKNKSEEPDSPPPSKDEMDTVFSSLLSDSNAPKPSKGQKRKQRKYSSSSSGEDNLENFFQNVRKENASEFENENVENLVKSSASLIGDVEQKPSQAFKQKRKRRLLLNDSSSDDEVLARKIVEPEDTPAHKASPSLVTCEGQPSDRNDEHCSPSVSSESGSKMTSKKKKNKRLIIDENSSSDDEVERKVRNGITMKEVEESPKGKQKLILDDGDSSSNDDEPAADLKLDKVVQSSDESTSQKVRRRTKMLISDDEDE